MHVSGRVWWGGGGGGGRRRRQKMENPYPPPFSTPALCLYFYLYKNKDKNQRQRQRYKTVRVWGPPVPVPFYLLLKKEKGKGGASFWSLDYNPRNINQFPQPAAARRRPPFLSEKLRTGAAPPDPPSSPKGLKDKVYWGASAGTEL